MLFYHCQLEDFENAGAIRKLEDSMRGVPDVAYAEVDFATAVLTIGVNSESPLKQLQQVARSLGVNLRNPVAQRRATIQLPELQDPVAEKHIREFLAKHLQIGKCVYNTSRRLVTLYFDPVLSEADLLCELNNNQIVARPYQTETYRPKYRVQDFFTLIAGLSLLAAVVIEAFFSTLLFWKLGLYLTATALTAPELARRGFFRSFAERQINSDVALFVCVLVTFATERWMEAAFLSTCYGIVLLFQRYSISRMRYVLLKLKAQLYPIAHVIRSDGSVVTMPSSTVNASHFVVVRKGEYLPVDGKVLRGEGLVDTCSVKGTQEQLAIKPGAKVHAGFYMVNGEVIMQVRSAQRNSVLASALRELDSLQKLDNPDLDGRHRLGRRFSQLCIVASIALFATSYVRDDYSLDQAIEHGLLFLLIASTSSYVIATRIVFTSALARLASWGIYLKRNDIWQALSRVHHVIVDKTGTLTVNRPEVTSVISLTGAPVKSVLSLAASLCRKGEKRLHRSVVRHAKQNATPLLPAAAVKPLHNKGLEGDIGNSHYQLVPSKRLTDLGIADPQVKSKLSLWESELTSALLLLENGRVIGVITITDPLRDKVGQLVELLRTARVGKTTILTSDNPGPSTSFGDRYGYDAVQGECDTEDKIRFVDTEYERDPGTVVITTNKALLDQTHCLTISIDNAAARSPMKRGDVAIIPGDPNFFAHAIMMARVSTGQIKAMTIALIVYKALLIATAVMGMVTLWEAMVTELLFALYALHASVVPARIERLELPAPRGGEVLKPNKRARTWLRSNPREFKSVRRGDLLTASNRTGSLMRLRPRKRRLTF